MLTKQQAAKFLGVTVRTLERYTEQGQIGGRYEKGKTRSVLVYDEGELRAFKKELETKTYKQLKYLKTSHFKRKCGVTLEIFKQMADVLRSHLDRRGKWGFQCRLSVEDQLLVVLEYWREYRTQFHIATSWGIARVGSVSG